jgi:hypothetical protein
MKFYTSSDFRRHITAAATTTIITAAATTTISTASNYND